jgi:hypothetical protein
VIPEYAPPSAYGDHARGTWTFTHKRRIAQTLRAKGRQEIVTEEEAERREFRRRFIDEPRRRELENYMRTGEIRVIP